MTGINKQQMLQLVVVVAVVGGAVVGPVAAQESAAPSVTVTNGDISVDAGERHNVTAKYQFSVENPGNGDERLTAISGTLWRFPGRTVSDITAKVNGKQVQPSVSRSNRHTTVSVPVDNVKANEKVTVKVSYTVSGPAGKVKAPIWVPDYQTSGSNRVIDMTVTLPEGANPQGSEFPTYDSRDGNTLRYSLLQVPGMVFLEYGSGSGSIFALDTTLSALGIVFIIAFFAIWLRFARSEAGGENVA